MQISKSDMSRQLVPLTKRHLCGVRPLQDGFFFRLNAVPQIQVDQILIGHARFSGQPFEVRNGFLIETNGNLSL